MAAIFPPLNIHHLSTTSVLRVTYDANYVISEAREYHVVCVALGAAMNIMIAMFCGSGYVSLINHALRFGKGAAIA